VDVWSRRLSRAPKGRRWGFT